MRLTGGEDLSFKSSVPRTVCQKAQGMGRGEHDGRSMGRYAISLTCSYHTHHTDLSWAIPSFSGHEGRSVELKDLLTHCQLHGQWPSPEVQIY